MSRENRILKLRNLSFLCLDRVDNLLMAMTDVSPVAHSDGRNRFGLSDSTGVVSGGASR
jgi:hypothetical protein